MIQERDTTYKCKLSAVHYSVNNRCRVDILDAREADLSTVFLPASPTVVHPTSSYFRQCYNANPRCYCQSRGLL